MIDAVDPLILDFPDDQVTECVETELAHAYAVRFDVADDLLLEHLASGKPVVAAVHHGHPTHWAVVAHAQGYARPQDNGWSAWFFPKALYSLAQVLALLRAILAR